MKARAIIPLVVGLVVGGIAIKMFLNGLKNAKGASNSDVVEVVRAAADIAPTIEITDAMLNKSSVPRSLAPEGTFTDIKKVSGRVSSQMIPKGMPVVASLLAPEGTPPGMAAKIREGYRAVAISVDEIVGVGGFIKPGTRVDVVFVASGTGSSKNQTFSKVILQNVEVLAVGQKIESGGQNAAVTRSVTVLVKPEDASKLSLASTKGKLRLAMRSQDDDSEPRPAVLTDEDLLADAASSRNRQNAGDSLWGRLFNLPKEQAEQVDTKAPAPDQTEPAPQQKEWVVEVLSGSEAYKLKFDQDGRCGEQIPLTTGQARNAKKPPRAPSRTFVPIGDSQENATDSKTPGSKAGNNPASVDYNAAGSSLTQDE